MWNWNLHVKIVLVLGLEEDGAGTLGNSGELSGDGLEMER
jgi:hypothetical protein